MAYNPTKTATFLSLDTDTCFGVLEHYRAIGTVFGSTVKCRTCVFTVCDTTSLQ